MNKVLRDFMREYEREKCPRGGDVRESEIQRALDPVVRRLSAAESSVRRDAVSRLREHAIPEVKSRLVDRLIGVLRTGGEGARLRAARSLAEIGPAAVPALRHALFTARTAAVQLPLVQVLGRIGRALPPQKRVRIQADLDIVAGRALSDDVVGAIVEAQDGMNPMNQASP
jgi:hypothetical protein